MTVCLKQEKHAWGKAQGSDTGEDLAIHEDLAEAVVEETIEEDYFSEESIINDDSDEDCTMAGNGCLLSPAHSILDMDSPPTSPNWNPVDVKLSADAPPLLDLDDPSDEDMLVGEILDLEDNDTRGQELFFDEL